MWCASSSWASGITLAKYGGIHGHPNVDGGLSLYWNPARLGVEPGFFVSLDATGIRRAAEYDRASAFEELRHAFRSEDPDVLEAYMNDPQVREEYERSNVGLATTSTVAVLPYGAFGYARELGSHLQGGLAFGLYPAFGGGGSWDRNLDAPASPGGAVDGPQRWASISSNLMVLHYTTGVGLTVPRYGASLGFSASYVTSELETVRARNANRSDAIVNPRGQLEEGRIWFNGSDSTWAFTVAAALDAGNIRAGAVYRFRHSVRMTGPLDIAFGVANPERTNAFVDFPFPDVFETSLSASVGRLTLTGITNFTQWSLIRDNDAQTITPAGDIERLLLIPRNLRNTFSMRGLAEWRFSDRLEVGVMLGLDPSAVPEETLDPGLSDAFKIQTGLGARIRFTDGLRLNTSLMHDFFFEAESTNSLHEPRLNGTYRDVRTYLNLSLEARL